MGTKVRDIVSTGDAFAGSLSAAMGCTSVNRLPVEFEVIEANINSHRVCKQHLVMTVRECIVKHGTGVIVLDAVTGDRCQYAGALGPATETLEK